MNTYTVKYHEQTIEIDIYPRERIEELKERIRLGNSKLNKAWDDICKMDKKSEHWKNEFEKWHLANVKLSAYCDQLTRLGWLDCLYINEKGEKYQSCLEALGCRVCPSTISYWEREYGVTFGKNSK